MGQKSFTVQLSGPICACPYQSLRLNISAATSTEPAHFQVWCEECRTVLNTPINGARGNIVCDVAYPKGVKSIAQKGLEGARSFLGSLKKEK